MDSEYCNGIGDLMDRAQVWCLDIVELQSKASKGDASKVGVFSYNSQVTVFEFLETAELAYLAWGNSVQKANLLYNKHLSVEIKSHIINM